MGNSACKPYSWYQKCNFHDSRIRQLTEKDANEALELMVQAMAGDKHINGNSAWRWIFQDSDDKPGAYFKMLRQNENRKFYMSQVFESF